MGIKSSTNKQYGQNKEARNIRLGIALEKRKKQKLAKFKDYDPMTVSGTTLQLMRKNSTDEKWKKCKGKEVRLAYKKRTKK